MPDALPPADGLPGVPFSPDAPLAAVLFDMDGVIVDTEPLHEAALLHLFARRAWPVDDPRFLDLKGRTEAENFAGLAARFGGDAEAHRTIYYDDYRTRLAHAALVPGVRAFIEALRGRGVHTALVTSARTESQATVFARHGLAALFDTVVTAGDVARPKPAPDPYLMAAARLGVSPAHSLVVEDALHGVHSGVAAGSTVAGFVASFTADALREAGAALTFTAFADLHATVLGGA